MIPVFKIVRHDMSAFQDEHFYYPTSGPVIDKDGWGLHGLPWGIGEPSHWSLKPNGGKYLVILTNADLYLSYTLGKCKFSRGNVVGCYDNVGHAALHIAELTQWWTTPDVVGFLDMIVYPRWTKLKDLAEAVRDRSERTIAALTEGALTREQRWREQVSTGILVPDWPVPVPVPKPHDQRSRV